MHPGQHQFFRGNSTIIGWEGDKDAAILKENGWFFIRDGVDTMASFMISACPQPGRFKWYPHSGCLPCFVTEFDEKNCAVSMSTFADKVTINGRDFVIAYTRVSIHNPTDEDVEIEPKASAILTPLTAAARGVVAAGRKETFDYAVVTDRFGNDYPRPTSEEVVAAGTWDAHFEHMKAFWEGRLAKIVSIRTPDPELNNAYRLGFIYTLITRDGETDYHTGEFGYDVMYNHDYLGILTTLFKLGFYENARQQLRIVGQGVGNYHDQFYRWGLPLSVYLQKTGDLGVLSEDDGFVFKKCTEACDKTLNDIDPANGLLKPTWDIDEDGWWTWDNESALTGFACYKFVALAMGNRTEAERAQAAYDALIANINRRLLELTDQSGITYISASLEMPNEKLPAVMERGSSFWATPFWFGMNWDTFLAGGKYEGPIFDRIDATYDWGFSKMRREGFEPHNVGTWVRYGGGVSSVYNAAFCLSALLGKQHRQEAIQAYQFLLNNGQSAPYGFWEMFHAPDPNNPWNGRHPAENNNWYCCPHQWGQAGATQALLDALAAEFYDGRILVGRGYLTEWCQPGLVTEITNFPICKNGRLSLRIEFLAAKTVQLTVGGSKACGSVLFNLPCFMDNIERASAGHIDHEHGMVSLEPEVQTVTVTLRECAGIKLR
jgi:hypothetical protein